MFGYFFQPDPAVMEENGDLYLSMGITAENVAERYGIERENQDRFALQSHQRAIDAIDQGTFEAEIVPLKVEETIYQNGAAQTIVKQFRSDEGPRRDTNLTALSRLRPVFKNEGTVTAGNASQRSDGAAATVVMSEQGMDNIGVMPMAIMIGYAVSGVSPAAMGIAPVSAVRKVLKQTRLDLKDVGLVELNEAFASQWLAVIQELGLREEIVNVNGGAIALGHPLGCTGAKLTTTLLHEMVRRSVRYGICTMCIGGGMGAAGVFENLML